MSNEIHNEEERDLIEVTGENMRQQPLWQTAPERIWLAVGDEPEDWQHEFHDCTDVTWADGGFCPVSVGVEYVRADLYDELHAAAARLSVERAEFRREAESLRASLATAEALAVKHAKEAGELAARLAQLDAQKPAVFIRVGDDLMIEEVCSLTDQEIPPGEHRYYAEPAPQVPDGYVLVPKEPTHAMLRAADRYETSCAIYNYGGRVDAEGVWDAMLAAAQKEGK